jgi:uncharacterized protein
MKQLQRGFRYLYLRLLRLRSTAEEIARGFAFGVFWGMFPLPGLQMAIAILTAAIFRCSKIAAAAGTWLSNPLTTLPFTALNFHVGQTVLGREWTAPPIAELRSLDGILNLGSDVITSFLAGCAVVGFAAALISYFLALPLVAHLQKRHIERRHKRRQAKHFHHKLP